MLKKPTKLFLLTLAKSFDLKNVVTDMDFFICRICCCSSSNMVSLMEYADRERILWIDIFSCCTQLVASLVDDFPKQICANCSLELMVAYKLQRKAKESEDAFRKQLLPYVESNTDELVEYCKQASESECTEHTEDATTEEQELIEFDPESYYWPVENEATAENSLESACNKGFFTTMKDNLAQNIDLEMYYLEEDYNQPVPLLEFQCHICQKTFKVKQNLQQHLLRHKGVKRYHCFICQKEFFVKSSLIAHSIIHDPKAGRFSCNVCEKTFAYKSALIVHQRFHNGELPYQCSVCDKKFPMKSHFNDHVAKHTGELFPCGDCDKHFQRRDALRNHRRIVHKQNEHLKIHGDVQKLDFG